MSKIVTVEPRPINRERTAYGQPLLADILANASGNAAWMHGHTSGAPYVDAEEVTGNPAPRNPHGRLGHDHSGGIFGKPLFRSIATHGLERGGRLDSNWAGNASGEEGFAFASGTLNPFSTADLATQYKTRPFMVWPPNCDRGPYGAYNNLAVALLIDMESTSLITGDTIDIRLRNLAPQFEGREIEFNVTAPETAGEELLESADATLLPMIPGVPNLIEVEIDLLILASGTTRGGTMSLVSFEMGVYS